MPNKYISVHIEMWKTHHCTELSFLGIHESRVRIKSVGYNPPSPHILYIDLTHFSQYVSKAVFSAWLEGIQLLNHLFS